MSEKKIIGIIVIAVVGTFVAVLTLSVYNGEQRLMKLSNGPYIGLPDINKFCHDKLKEQLGTEPNKECK